MIEFKPTEEQAAAIAYEGSFVAIAKPGSGKTFVLSRKIAAVLQKLPQHRGVIAISYTNKASDELRRRVASSGADRRASFFGTIDKFCDGEIIIPFLPHLWGKPEDDISIVRIRDLPEHDQEVFSGIEENQVSLRDVEERIETLRSRFLKGQLLLETSGALALFTLTHSAACKRYVRARYSHIVIDEYQDSGLEQHELFLAVQRLGLVAVAVGDADQSIFGFSNKNSKYLLGLAKDPAFRLFPITFNHRCHPSIINYSMRLIDERAALLDADAIRVFYKSCAGTAAAVAKWIEATLPKLMAEYSVSKASDVGILVRSNVTGALVDRSLGARHRYFAAHPLEDHFSLWARLFCQLLAYRYDVNRTAQEIIDAVSSRLKEAEVREARGLIKSLRECDDVNLFVVMEAIACLLLPDARKDEPVEILRSSAVADLASHFAPADDDELQVMSIHKSKGLEFDLVFHLDLYEWVLPSKQPGPGNDFDNPDYPDWEQDANIHYVGITRARKACFLCTSSRRINSKGDDKAGKPSEFLALPGLAELRRNCDF
jgi:superfamily I DNA/RNA helicase